MQRGHYSVCEPLAGLQMVIPKCLVVKSPEITGALHTGLLHWDYVVHGASLPPCGATLVLPAKRMLFRAGTWATP